MANNQPTNPTTPNNPGNFSRRGFLATSAAAGAGILLNSAKTMAQVTSTGGEINVALIGAGTQGREALMECSLKIPGVNFKAVCDIWPYHQRYAQKRLRAQKMNVNVYSDYREMLDKEKDLHAAIVATPEWMHAEHAIACLEAGLHVYCEKEMSNSLEKARQMVLAMRKTGKLLQIGHQRRSNPRYQHAHDKLIGDAHIFGRLTHGYGQWHRGVSPDRGWAEKYALDTATLNKYGYKDMHTFRNWRWFKKHGGGPIVDLGSHQIDIFSWFFGADPVSVVASGGRDYYKNHEWYDNVLTIYEYDTPQGVARAFYEVLTTSSARGFFERFMGDEGTLQISEIASMVRVFGEARVNAETAWQKWADKGYIKATEAKEKPKPANDLQAVYQTPPVSTWLIPVEYDQFPHQAHLQNFFDAVRGKTQLNCDGEEAYKTAVAVLKVNEAVATGQKIQFKEEDFKA